MAASNSVNTLVTSALLFPTAVAVDGGGNVFIADIGNNAIEEWVAASNSVATLVTPGSGESFGVAVDAVRNVYIACDANNAIKELPRAFVDPTPKWEGAQAGSDALPVVLPATENLSGPYPPTSDQSWLTITGFANGVVNYLFSANPAPTSRTAHITLLGQSIPVTQAGPLILSTPILSGGRFQFDFSNALPNAIFTVLTTTNLSLPLAEWTVAATLTNGASNSLQFSIPTMQGPKRFYRVEMP